MRVLGSNASTSAMHLEEQSWCSCFSQVYLWVLLSVSLCGEVVSVHLVQKPPCVPCVLVVAVLVCALIARQALLFVWRVVVAVD